MKETLDSIKTIGGYKEDYLKLIEERILDEFITLTKPTHIIKPENME